MEVRGSDGVRVVACGARGRRARRQGHSYIGTEHLLLGLLAEPDGIASRVLTELGVAKDAADRLREIIASAGYNTPSSAVRYREQ